MHNWAKEIMEYVKTEVNSIGLKNIEMEHLCELEKWVCIADKIAEYDYYYHITESMEKPENEYGVNYDENGKFYTPMRSANGRFKRGYMPEYYRDMDVNEGRMYYTEGDMNGASMDSSVGSGRNLSNRGYSNGGNSNNGRFYSESRYERARKGYEDSKMMDPNSEHAEEIKEMFDELEMEIKELKPKMTAAEKNTARNKLSNMANSMV